MFERFKLNQYQEMMAELEKKFGGSRQIIISVMKQLETMKVLIGNHIIKLILSYMLTD